MSRHVLDEIRANNPQDVVACKEQMISRWMNNDSLASPHCWWSLVKALKGMGENGIARKIENEHGKLWLSYYSSIWIICIPQVLKLTFKRSFLSPSIPVRSQMMTSSSHLQELLETIGFHLLICSPVQHMKWSSRQRRRELLKLTRLYTCSEGGLQKGKQLMVCFVRDSKQSLCFRVKVCITIPVCTSHTLIVVFN